MSSVDLDRGPHRRRRADVVGETLAHPGQERVGADRVAHAAFASAAGITWNLPAMAGIGLDLRGQRVLGLRVRRERARRPTAELSLASAMTKPGVVAP